MNMKKTKLNPRENVVRRLKIVEGHLGKVIKMVEDNVYCIDVLQQTAAVRNAVKKAEEVLLVNHLNHCVVKAIKSNSQAKAIEELAQVFRKIG